MQKKNHQDVRQRLLSVGLKLFAERGYESATVREICDAAQSNLAAINYYFRDKAGYYDEVRSYAVSVRMAELDRLNDVLTSSDPWELLGLLVDSLLNNTFDSEMFLSAWFCFRDYLSYGSHQRLQSDLHVNQETQHDFENRLRELMQRLLGDAATEENVALLHYTYVSLSLFLVIEAKVSPSNQSALKLLPHVTRQRLHDHIVGLVRASVLRMKEEHARRQSPCAGQ